MKAFLLLAFIAFMAKASAYTVFLEKDPHFQGLGPCSVEVLSDADGEMLYRNGWCGMRRAFPYDSPACFLRSIKIIRREDLETARTLGRAPKPGETACVDCG